MAHITIEYSANLAEHHDVGALVEAVHEAAAAHGLTSLDGLRTRAVARTHYRVADGDRDHAFVAIAVRVGPGRDPAARTRSWRRSSMPPRRTSAQPRARWRWRGRPS